MVNSGGGGGGAEEHARSKQYGYKANSSLVLHSDERVRDNHEPSGEPETLRGKIDPKSFGDRVAKGRPREFEERLNNSRRKKKEREVGDDSGFAREGKRRRIGEVSVLSDSDDGVYQPKTKETRAAYEAMLSIIQQQLCGQPLSIVCGAADEILAVLKNGSVKNSEKKIEIEKLLNRVSNHVFDQFVAIGKLITDYEEVGDSGSEEGIDNDMGVAVEFEEHEEDDNESDLDMVQEENDDEEGVVVRTGVVRSGVAISGEDAEHGKDGGTSLNVQDIDAYWLQRKLFQGYEEQIDPQECKLLAEEVLKILADGSDMDVENKLLMHLKFDKFSLVRFLLHNHLKVVWCTRLARASDQEERNQIVKEMMGLGPELSAIAEELHAKRATAKEREENQEKNIIEEARRLNDVSGGGRIDVDDRDSENGWMKGQRQMLELKSLAFDQGGFLNKNKKCILPPKSCRIQNKEYEEVHVPWVLERLIVMKSL